MKKFLTAFAALCVASLLFAETEMVDGIEWTYTVSDGEARIGGRSAAIPTSTTGAITIPSTLGGYPVTSIGYSAFKGCMNLTSVTVPGCVTSIGTCAFDGCASLASVTVPGSVTNIGEFAFYRCTNLTSVTILNGVSSIEEHAFYDCSGLTSMAIPDSVTKIGSVTFGNCRRLKSFSVTAGNQSYKDDSGLLLSKDGKTLVAGITDRVRIPDGVTSIGWAAFCGRSGLTSVSIPNSVTNIDGLAFCECNSLTSVTMPDSVVSIGEGAFSSCSGLTSMTIPESVTSIGGGAFSGCSGLKSFSVAADNPSYKADSGLLLTKDGKTIVAVPCGLTSVTIPNSVKKIGDSAFVCCSGLTSVTIPNNVTSIGAYAFFGCTNLTGVTIPNSVASIGECAFSRCSGLTSMTIPESVTNIGKSAFHGCTNLTRVTIPDRVTNIGDAAFAHCSRLTSMTIPDSVISIGNSAFFGCRGLRQAVLPQRLNGRLHSSVFAKCPVKITYSAARRPFRRPLNLKAKTETVNGIEWTYTIYGGEARIGGRSAAIPISTTGAITIPSALGGKPVTSIGYSAFKGCNRLASVTIPNGVTCIGDNAFLMCGGMTSVTIPSSVTNIGWSAFSGCRRLKSLTIPEGVERIGRGAFSGCCGLTSVTIPASVMCIEERAFFGSPELYNREANGWSVRRGNGPAGVGLMSFAVDSGNPSYSSRNGLLCSKDGADLIVGVNGDIKIPEGVKNIGKYAFSDCHRLTSVTIPSSVTNIGFRAFCNCSELKSVTIPSSVTSIESCGVFGTPFSGTPFYRNMPDGMVVLGGGVLCGYKGKCPSTVTIPSSVTSIGDYAFDMCEGITSVMIPSSVTNVGVRAFSGCKGLTSVTIPSSVTSIGGDAFNGTPFYRNMPDGMVVLGGGVLCGYKGKCPSAITIPSNVASIADCAFSERFMYQFLQRRDAGLKPDRLKTVVIASSVTNIGDRAFSYCGELTSVTMRGERPDAPKNIFERCGKLKSIHVPANAKSWAGMKDWFGIPLVFDAK